MPPNDWKEWSKFVLAELQRLSNQSETTNTSIDKLVTKLGEVRIEVGMLKVKSGIWGLCGGLIPVAILILAQIYMASRK